MENILRERDIDNELMKELIKEEPSFDRLNNLLNEGADINSLSIEDGYNCLNDIIYKIPNYINKDYKPTSELILFMIDKGADVNYYDKQGFSVVHSCIYSDFLDLLELVLKKGANPNIVFKETGTPYDFAYTYLYADDKEFGKPYLDLLKKYGGVFSCETRTNKLDTYLEFNPFLRKKTDYIFGTPNGFLNPLYFEIINESELKTLREFNLKFKDIEKIELDSDLCDEIKDMNVIYLKKAFQIYKEIGLSVIFSFDFLDIYENGTFGNAPLIGFKDYLFLYEKFNQINIRYNYNLFTGPF